MMKSLYLLPLATATCLLNSCGNMNDPIYYDGKPTPAQNTANQPAPTVVQNTQATPAHTHTNPPVSAPTKRPTGLRKTGPYMQPDVFGMPNKEDLKETATSTKGSAGNQGLSVPSQ
ncbi:hypothetical protein ACFSW8_00495 [Rubritalea tangerina]|uniref:Lipoprotein n=2 Tax=Rubritalea tangerina TaxID=430798 RepID=A0ABW4Z690_9BACT